MTDTKGTGRFVTAEWVEDMDGKVGEIQGRIGDELGKIAEELRMRHGISSRDFSAYLRDSRSKWTRDEMRCQAVSRRPEVLGISSGAMDEAISGYLKSVGSNAVDVLAALSSRRGVLLKDYVAYLDDPRSKWTLCSQTQSLVLRVKP